MVTDKKEKNYCKRKSLIIIPDFQREWKDFFEPQVGKIMNIWTHEKIMPEDACLSSEEYKK